MGEQGRAHEGFSKKRSQFDKVAHSAVITSTYAFTRFTYFISIITHPPTPNPQFSMASAVKLPVFRGVGNEGLDQFWFVVRAVWEAQGVTDDNIKKPKLVSTLQDHTLTWYIKHSNDHPNTIIVEI